MKGLVLLVVATLAIASCSPGSQSEQVSSTSPPVAVSTTEQEATSTTEEPITTTAPPRETTTTVPRLATSTTGELPDGTPYTVTFDVPMDLTAREVSGENTIAYPGFEVRPGCGELAVACSAAGVVQVVPDTAVAGEESGLPADLVWIDSTAPRPADQPSYMDPGPLSIRAGHDAIWTGREMIVWGGADGDRVPHLTDGAAFDPKTAQWRLLAPAPLPEFDVTRAVWTGSAMIVISRQATLAYDPETDTWTQIADGLYPAEHPLFTVWTGDSIATWTSAGIFLLDPPDTQWQQLPDLDFGESDLFAGQLLALDGDVVAIGPAGSFCSGRRLARWTGEEWDELPQVNLGTETLADCSFPNQVGIAGGGLIAWEDENHPTEVFDGEEWIEIASIPLRGTEGASGGIGVGDGLLVPQGGEIAYYKAGRWTTTVSPGHGFNHDMVWTGTEILMWGHACCFGDGRSEFSSMDAWRWTPPWIEG